MRLRVRIDVRVPLRKGKKIIHPDGLTSKTKFKLERLPNYCFFCRLLGHVEKFRPKVRRSIEDTAAIPRAWGPELRAPTFRTVKEGDMRWLDDGRGAAESTKRRSVSWRR